jgi:hypothetical protein
MSLNQPSLPTEWPALCRLFALHFYISSSVCVGIEETLEGARNKTVTTRSPFKRDLALFMIGEN